MVVSCWWIVVIVLYAVYTGNLIAFLTVSIPYMPFNTLEGMVGQTEYVYGLEDGIIHMMLFRVRAPGRNCACFSSFAFYCVGSIGSVSE